MASESDFHRLARWLLVVGVVAGVLVGLVVIALVLFGGTAVPD